MTDLVHVAVGVVTDTHGRVLIARRPKHVHQGDLWEFPGGKVNSHESLVQALTRELWEELAIVVKASEPLIRISHDYGDKTVLLDVHRVTAFTGDPKGNEGQPVRWVVPRELEKYQFPDANRSIIKALNLPKLMLISGGTNFFSDYLTRIRRALDNGVGLFQLRCPDMAADEYRSLAEAVAALYQGTEAQWVCNTSPECWARMSLPAGLHLNRRQLTRCSQRPVPESVLLGASCHNAEEIRHACMLGVDYLTLSPVLPTSSHPGVAGLGWDRFAALVEFSSAPVYAQGGMKETDISRACEAGAQGVAGISFGW